LGLFSVGVQYSETCEIRTPLGRAKSVPTSEVSSFHRAISTENRGLGPDEVSLFQRMSSFCRVAINRFHRMSTLDRQSDSLTVYWSSGSVWRPICSPSCDFHSSAAVVV
jgi:hypothetical protein